MNSKKMIGVTLAAAALAFTVVPAASFAKSAKMPCYNVKGEKGSVMKTEKQCKKAGGTTTAPAADAAAPAVDAAAPAAAETPAS